MPDPIVVRPVASRDPLPPPQVVLNNPAPNRRNNRPRWIASLVTCVACLTFAIIGFIISIMAFVFTSNINSGAFWSQALMIIGVILMLVGVCMRQNGRGWMLAGLIITPLGIIMIFIGLIIDGVSAKQIGDTNFPNCSYYSTGLSLICDKSGAVIPTELEGSCKYEVAQQTCFCCYLYHQNECKVTPSIQNAPPAYEAVDSCEDVTSKYQTLLWLSVVFNLIVLILGLVSSSLVAQYKGSIKAINVNTSGGVITIGGGRSNRQRRRQQQQAPMQMRPIQSEPPPYDEQPPGYSESMRNDVDSDGGIQMREMDQPPPYTVS